MLICPITCYRGEDIIKSDPPFEKSMRILPNNEDTINIFNKVYSLSVFL